MKKYTLNEIKIKSPGVQIREKILDKYGSIRKFAEVIDLYESSIHQYLSSKNLGSSTFKIRTTRAFEMDFNDLFESDIEQVSRFVSDVSLYIDLYNQVDDIQILDSLKMITLENEYFEEYAVICRCYAYYYYNQGLMDRAIAYIDVAVNTMRGRENVDRFGLYFSDMILMKSHLLSRSEVKKIRKEFLEILKKVTGPLTTGHMHRNIARAFFLQEEYGISEKYYKQVLDYHHDNKSVSFIYMKLGDIKKATGHMQAALKYYEKSENLIEDADPDIYHVFDEYAQYYIDKGNFEKADEYIDRIFGHDGWQISSYDHNFIVTHNRVKDHFKRYDDIEKVLMRILEDLNSGYIYASHHIGIFGRSLNALNCPDSILDRFISKIVKFRADNNLSNVNDKILRILIGDIVIQMRENI